VARKAESRAPPEILGWDGWVGFHSWYLSRGRADSARDASTYSTSLLTLDRVRHRLLACIRSGRRIAQASP
jgi:hypothetical protein